MPQKDLSSWILFFIDGTPGHDKFHFFEGKEGLSFIVQNKYLIKVIRLPEQWLYEFVHTQ